MRQKPASKPGRLPPPLPGRLPRTTWAATAPPVFMLYVSLIVFLVAYTLTDGAYGVGHPPTPLSTDPTCPLMKFRWSGLARLRWASLSLLAPLSM